MGYVFDAMSRANESPEPDPKRPAGLDASDDDVIEAALDAVDAAEAEGLEAPGAPEAPPASLGEGATDVAPPEPVRSPIALDAKQRAKLDDRLVAVTAPESIMAEEYRGIRTSLLARWEHRRHLVHTVTSATPQEGKTLTSLNLGLSFAELRNRRTIVVEADLRLPTFAKLTKLGPTPGLIGLLRGEARLAQVVQQLGERGLSVLPAGGRANNEAVQLLSGQAMSDLLGELRQHYDHVILDTPPVIELADAGILGAMSDEVLLVARLNRTPRTLIEQAVRTLSSYHAPVGGLIATDRRWMRQRYYYYRYGYRYGYYRKGRAA